MMDFTTTISSLPTGDTPTVLDSDMATFLPTPTLQTSPLQTFISAATLTTPLSPKETYTLPSGVTIYIFPVIPSQPDVPQVVIALDERGREVEIPQEVLDDFRERNKEGARSEASQLKRCAWGVVVGVVAAAWAEREAVGIRIGRGVAWALEYFDGGEGPPL
jgi:hypothetical protein